jgi:hypothetical protein
LQYDVELLVYDRFFKVIERALFFHRAHGVFNRALPGEQNDGRF